VADGVIRTWLAVSGCLLVAAPGKAQDTAATWKLSARPTLVIGGVDQRTRFLRIGAVTRLPDGRIAVPNGGTNEIRIFDRRGAYLNTVGRSGAGPGEFRSLSLLGVSGDTLLVFDATGARITLYLADGTLAGTIPVTARSPERLGVVGRLRNGRWAVRTTSTPGISGPQRIFRDTARIGTIDPDGSGEVAWLGEFPGATLFVYNPSGAPIGTAVGLVPLAPAAVGVVAGDEILIGDTGGNVIGAFSDRQATVLRLITLPLDSIPLTDARIASSRSAAIRRNPSAAARPYLTALHSRATMGTRLPGFTRILPAPDASVWVERGGADSPDPVTWMIVDSSGKPVATLQSPAGFRITEVGPSYVLGVHTGPDGVETVRMYQLITP
jgi:hypothetical protein